MNMGDILNDFLCEVRERGGFANDLDFDLIVGQVFIDKIRTAIAEEREACAEIAETIRARELAKYTGANCPYDTIAEEIRDRIQMRPDTSNKDWRELPGLNKITIS